MSLNWKRETIYRPGTVLSVPVYGLKDLKAFYAGGDKVITGDRAQGRIAVITLAEYSRGRPITVVLSPDDAKEGKAWLKAARAQVGRRYSLIVHDMDRFVDQAVGRESAGALKQAFANGLALAAGLFGVGAPSRI